MLPSGTPVRCRIEFGDRVLDPTEEGFDVVIRFSGLSDSALMACRLGAMGELVA